ncbi:MAG: hypothetical protein HOC20_11680 [Chloroflexi bacterium]|jgi:hypothetical protein|nr:hypothetical protein [Chloroflexota bacterium]
MMTIYGMLAPEDTSAGYNLALDDDWYAVLLEKDQVIARFDPRDYTTVELQTEVEKLLQVKRSDQAA